MALNTDYAIRTGAFEPAKKDLNIKSVDQKEEALNRYNNAKVSFCVCLMIYKSRNIIWFVNAKNAVGFLWLSGLVAGVVW